MTDITKRLAEASEAWKSARTTHGLMQAGKAMSAAIDTAAQEANVQDNNARGIPASELYAAFRGDEFTPYAWKQLSNAQRAQWQRVAAAASGAPHPTPAPASGEVTDALPRYTQEWVDYCRDEQGERVPGGGFEWTRDDAKGEWVKYKDIEAATRARHGEGEQRKPDGYAYRYPSYLEGATAIHFNNGTEVNGNKPIEAIPYFFGTPSAQPQAGTVAAQGEAYRAVTLEDAADLAGEMQGDPIADLFRAMQSIGCVIPTAAPVPADEGEKK